MTLAIKKNGFNIRETSTRLQNDKDLILIALDTYQYIYNQLSTELKNDNDIVSKFIKKDITNYICIPSCYQYNKDIILDIIPKRPSYLRYISNVSEDIILELIPKNIKILKYIPNNLKNNKNFNKNAYDIINKNILYQLLLYYPSYLRDIPNVSEDIILEIIPKNNKILKYISNELKNDRNFIKNVKIIFNDAIKYASKKLQKDIPFIIELYSIN